MKYLGLHKLIWLVILIVFTLFEIAMICVAYVVYILWYFKLPPNLWKITHTSTKSDELCGVYTKIRTQLKPLRGGMNLKTCHYENRN